MWVSGCRSQGSSGIGTGKRSFDNGNNGLNSSHFIEVVTVAADCAGKNWYSKIVGDSKYFHMSSPCSRYSHISHMFINSWFVDFS